MRSAQRLFSTLALAGALLGSVAACEGTASTEPHNSGTMMPVDQSATMWCMKSPEPARCRARSGVEHQMCAANPANYSACRFSMDQMHGP